MHSSFELMEEKKKVPLFKFKKSRPFKSEILPHNLWDVIHMVFYT